MICRFRSIESYNQETDQAAGRRSQDESACAKRTVKGSREDITMRLFRSIIFVALATVTALVYVHQQVELVKLSYAIECKEKKLKDMLDHRESLGYNIDNLESPFRLEQVLISRKIDVSFPKKGHIVSVAKLASRIRYEEHMRVAFNEKKFNLFGFLDFFTPRAEAQAREK